MPQGRETVNVPIFPIHGVLFPGMHVHVELSIDRFRQAFDDLARRDVTLSVSLVRPLEGTPPKAPDPHHIGTTARILNIVGAGPDAGEAVLVGVSRIRLLSYHPTGEYLIGQACYLPDLPESVPALLFDEARALGSELSAAVGLADDRANVVGIPRHPEMLSYWIGQHLPIGLEDRQELLELRTTSARLSKEVAHMRTILDSLRAERSS